VTITLPQITGSTFYRRHTIKKKGATGSITVACQSGDTVEDSSTYSMGTTNNISRTFEAANITASCSAFLTEGACTPSGCTPQYGSCTWSAFDNTCNGNPACDIATGTDQTTCESITYFSSCAGTYDIQKNWEITSAHL
jgi:hypothetical protein